MNTFSTRRQFLGKIFVGATSLVFSGCDQDVVSPTTGRELEPARRSNGVLVPSMNDLFLYNSQEAGRIHTAGEEIPGELWRTRGFDTFAPYAMRPTTFSDIGFEKIGHGSSLEYRLNAVTVHCRADGINSGEVNRLVTARFYSLGGFNSSN